MFRFFAHRQALALPSISNPATIRQKLHSDPLSRLLRTQQIASTSSSSVLLVQPRGHSDEASREALRLAETYAGGICRAITVGQQAAPRPNPATFFGKGVVSNLKSEIAELQPQKVVVNANLSGVQHRNLEGEWGVPVLDRVGLIIEIFAQRARTREARLQVELASLEYKASRLVRTVSDVTGKRGAFGEGAEVVSARERGRSGAASGGLGGSGGGGETELQLQRRRIAQRRKALRLKILEVQRTRQVQRAARQRSGKPLVAVVGYTNAGKSSLIEALTGHDVGAADQLFATLDTTMRSLHLHSGRTAIVSDTVGFISQLPTQLIDAFKGTLEEAVHADLLLHVIDTSSPVADEQRATVLSILRQLGLTPSHLHSRVLEVYNKVDLADDCESDDSTDHALALQRVSDAELVSSEDDEQLAAERWRPSEAGSSTEKSAAGAEQLRIKQSNVEPASDPQPAATSSKMSDKAIASAQREAARAAVAHLEGQRAPPPPDSRQQLGAASFSSVRVSALTGQGLEDLRHAIDRKLAVRNGLNELAVSTAIVGQRLLQQNVVGPARRWKRHRHLTGYEHQGTRPWQPQWLSQQDSLAGRVFGLQ